MKKLLCHYILLSWEATWHSRETKEPTGSKQIHILISYLFTWRKFKSSVVSLLISKIMQLGELSLFKLLLLVFLLLYPIIMSLSLNDLFPPFSLPFLSLEFSLLCPTFVISHVVMGTSAF